MNFSSVPASSVVIILDFSIVCIQLQTMLSTPLFLAAYVIKTCVISIFKNHPMSTSIFSMDLLILEVKLCNAVGEAF